MLSLSRENFYILFYSLIISYSLCACAFLFLNIESFKVYVEFSSILAFFIYSASLISYFHFKNKIAYVSNR